MLCNIVAYVVDVRDCQKFSESAHHRKTNDFAAFFLRIDKRLSFDPCGGLPIIARRGIDQSSRFRVSVGPAQSCCIYAEQPRLPATGSHESYEEYHMYFSTGGGCSRPKAGLRHVRIWKTIMSDHSLRVQQSAGDYFKDISVVDLSSNEHLQRRGFCPGLAACIRC